MSKKRKKPLLDISPRVRMIAITTVGVLLVVVILFTVAVLLTKPVEENGIPLTETQKKTRDANVQQAAREGALRDSADDALKRGDVDEAESIYKQAIESEEDIEKKIRLYIDESGVLYNNGKVKKAIEVAKKAESISDDKFLVADWLGIIYEDQGEYAQAKKYYLLAAEWVDSPMNKLKYNKAYYERAAKRVADKAQG